MREWDVAAVISRPAWFRVSAATAEDARQAVLAGGGREVGLLDEPGVDVVVKVTEAGR